MSSSYAPLPGHPAHEPMMEELRERVREVSEGRQSAVSVRNDHVVREIRRPMRKDAGIAGKDAHSTGC